LPPEPEAEAPEGAEPAAGGTEQPAAEEEAEEAEEADAEEPADEVAAPPQVDGVHHNQVISLHPDSDQYRSGGMVSGVREN
jgi:hypothetical protein